MQVTTPKIGLRIPMVRKAFTLPPKIIDFIFSKAPWYHDDDEVLFFEFI
jgi:hypothetical protein